MTTSMPEPTAPSSRGAIDLGALKKHAPEPIDAPAGTPSWVRQVDQALFPDIVALSQQVPVIVSLGSPRSPASVQLDELLAAVINAKSGTAVLATVDAEAEPQIAQAFQVTQVPSVIALINGQPVPMFQGSAEVSQIQSLLDELLSLGAQHGVAGTVPPFGVQGGEPAEVPLPPLHQAALEAIEAGDYTAAEIAYKHALNEKPNDTDAAIGLNQVRLLIRTQDQDLAAVRAAGAENPDDLAAQLAVADMDVMGGHVEDAFGRLVNFIGRNFGDEREAARARLVELYSIVGTNDERVVASRQKLARVLF